MTSSVLPIGTRVVVDLSNNLSGEIMAHVQLDPYGISYVIGLDAGFYHCFSKDGRTFISKFVAHSSNCKEITSEE